MHHYCMDCRLCRMLRSYALDEYLTCSQALNFDQLLHVPAHTQANLGTFESWKSDPSRAAFNYVESLRGARSAALSKEALRYGHNASCCASGSAATRSCAFCCK